MSTRCSPAGGHVADDRTALPVPTVPARKGFVRILRPGMSQEDRPALDRAAETLRAACERLDQ